ncbi:MAG TPA: hypothetical protein VG733_09120 [Chthoniobacteraceae bacterium]|nr:hypothetical protein [Chthoniobacteraceae bacterium]
MQFSGLFALLHLVLFIQLPVHKATTHAQTAPAAQAPQQAAQAPMQPAAQPSPTPAPAVAAATPAVAAATPPPKDNGKTLSGIDEAMIWVTSKTPRIKVETARGVSFNIDFATHSALCLSHISAELNTEPRGLTLSFNPTDGLLRASYDKEAKALDIFLRSSKEPLCTLPLKPSTVTTRVLLRQRQQLALFAVPPDGSQATLVWLGTVSYVLNFRNAGQYELCKDLKITMGKRDIPLEEFRSGIKIDALDEIADVVVTGRSPAGEAFKHSYTFDYKDVTKLVDGAYGSFMKAAGNPTTDDEAAAKQPPVQFTQ